MGDEMEYLITKEMLSQFIELSRKKKEIESSLEQLKNVFNQYFDDACGKNKKGEMVINEFKLQRQIRTTEKYEPEITVKRLQELHLEDLIQRKPDDAKIKSALHLGLLKTEDLKDCIKSSSSQAIYVKKIENE
jgi:hypothetical protein